MWALPGYDLFRLSLVKVKNPIWQTQNLFLAIWPSVYGFFVLFCLPKKEPKKAPQSATP
jgi:hypothetical protein